MRTIKFRGRNRYYGKWVYGDLLTSPNGMEFYIVEKLKESEYFLKNSDPIPVDPETVGQYINLNDKRGKDIYDFDLIKIVDEVFKVEWKFNRWILRSIKSNRIYEFREIDISHFYEVIGNVDENPELLNG